MCSSDLKIDGEAVRDIEYSLARRAPLRSTALALHTLNVDVIVEGVESAKQAEILSLIRLYSLQGDFYAPPMQPNRLEESLAYYAGQP